jgi:hypothetical protein
MEVEAALGRKRVKSAPLDILENDPVLVPGWSLSRDPRAAAEEMYLGCDLLYTRL